MSDIKPDRQAAIAEFERGFENANGNLSRAIHQAGKLKDPAQFRRALKAAQQQWRDEVGALIRNLAESE
jgi:hypothetical protein